MMTGNFTKDHLESAFIATGERDRVKEILLARLQSEGWVDQVKSMARKEIREQGIKEISVESLYDKLKVPSRKLVSSQAKQELYKLIRDWVAEQTKLHDL